MKSRCTERETRPGYPGTLPSFLSRSSQEPDTLSQDALKVASCLLWGDAPITAGVPKCDPTNRDYAAAMARVLQLEKRRLFGRSPLVALANMM